MDDILQLKAYEVAAKHRNEHEGFEYFKREIVPQSERKQCCVSLYEIPPGKSAYPYHYHMQNEEVFYILKGSGLLKTPSGQRTVSEGDFLFFPANEKGAHKLTNASDSELLIYLDFDTNNPIDVAFYPDSNKMGVFGDTLRQLYHTKDQAEYYDGE